jgi:hypothetical protein
MMHCVDVIDINGFTTVTTTLPKKLLTNAFALAHGAHRAHGHARLFVVFTIPIRGGATLDLRGMMLTTQTSTPFSRRNPA